MAGGGALGDGTLHGCTVFRGESCQREGGEMVAVLEEAAQAEREAAGKMAPSLTVTSELQRRIRQSVTDSTEGAVLLGETPQSFASVRAS